MYTGVNSDTSQHRHQRRDQINPSRAFRHKVGAPILAEQQAEAAFRELRERFDRAEAEPENRQASSEATRCAWRLLSMVGFEDFDAIRHVRTDDFPHVIDPSQHGLVSLALEILGWYHFGLERYHIDRTARIFDRCLELTPHNQRALERFAVVATEMRPEYIGGFAGYPKKQRETALGYKLQCKRKIDTILHDVFGITESHLVGQSAETVVELVKARRAPERRFVFNILGHLSQLNRASGEFFGNGTQLSLGLGAACCQLEILGLPRDLSHLFLLCRSRLDEDSDHQVAGEETPLLLSILRNISSLCDAKWRLFKNQAARRRVQEIQDLLREAEG